MVMHKGVLCRVKYRQGTLTRGRELTHNSGLELVMQMYITATSNMKTDTVKTGLYV